MSIEDNIRQHADEPRGTLRATREIVVNIHGEEYDCLLIPRKPFVEISYTRFPENDPFRRQVNAVKMTEMQLDPERDLNEGRLTFEASLRLLESL